MKMKLKGRRFDTAEEIQAESLRVLDILIAKDFQEAFQKWRETVGPVSTCRREILRGWWRPIGLMVSVMTFEASVRNILDIPPKI
jgi:hypothetical protein